MNIVRSIASFLCIIIGMVILMLSIGAFFMRLIFACLGLYLIFMGFRSRLSHSSFIFMSNRNFNRPD